MNHQDKLFVINMLSGNDKSRSKLVAAIKSNFNDAEIAIIKEKDDFNNAIDLAQGQKFNYIIINGGDGTINSFLPIIIEQKKILGILPSGSGNGLARTLNIPLNPIDALKIIQSNKVASIDAGELKIHSGNNGIKRYFACAIGFGLDAEITGRFEKQKIRGLWGYLMAAIVELFYHQSIWAKVETDKIEMENRFLILSVMNIPQYGNEFYLYPSAKINDGYLNLITLKKTNILMYPYVLWNILMKKERKPMQYFTCKKIKIKINHKKEKHMHIDGEPMILNEKTDLEINIIPNCLNVFTK